MLEYALAIVVVAVICKMSSDKAMSEGLAAISAAWAAWSGYILLTNDYEPWAAGIIFDSAAAWWLLRRPSTKMKSVLASIFCIQITMHIAYGLNVLVYSSADWQSYYDRTSIAGWLQLLIVGGWGIAGIIMRHNSLRASVRTPRIKESVRDMGDKA